jgi:Major intrinsic protein
MPGGLASSGYGDLTPANTASAPAYSPELFATFFFIIVIIGTTSKGAAVGFVGIPIGLCVTLIHLIAIPVTNTSVNPARSTSPPLFAGGEYIAQLWLLWLARSSEPRSPDSSRGGSTRTSGSTNTARWSQRSRKPAAFCQDRPAPGPDGFWPKTARKDASVRC